MSPKRQAPFSVFVAALYIAACVAPADDPAEKTWSVVYTQSGGIAGIHRRISLDHTGKLLMADLRTRKKKEKRISGDELRQFADAVFRSGKKTAGGGTPLAEKVATSRCRDCINHTFVIHFDKRTYRHSWRLTDQSAGRFAELARRLNEMAEK